MDKQELIKKWIAGNLNEEEQRHFEQSEEFRSLKAMSDSLNAFKASEYQVEEEYERLIAARDSRKKDAKVVRMTWRKTAMQVAAAVALALISYVFFLSNSQTTVQTLAAEKSEVWLPDSSFVAVNAHSTLAFSEDSWEDNREVFLDGEAYFKVDKGTKFDVKTQAGTISVLGTQFNVKQRNGFFEVVCYEGLVRVESEQGVVELKPHQQFRVVNGKLSAYNRSNLEAPAWIKGESTFESVPFRQVIEEFERQYKVKVQADQVNPDQLFTGRFTHTDKAVALKSIALPLNLEYQVEGKVITLTTK